MNEFKWADGFDNGTIRDQLVFLKKFNINPNKFVYQLEDDSLDLNAINIDDLTPNSDSAYRNIKIYKDKTYYVVTIYKKALFYKDIIRFSSVDKYSTDNHFKIDRNSKSTELLFHQEDGKWVYEEVID